MRPLKIAALAFSVIGGLLIVLLGIGVLLPSSWEAERSIWIEASPEAVFPHVASARAWETWTPSPDSGVEHFGPEEGAGSGRRWDDPGYGQGEFVIRTVQAPTEMDYLVEVEGGAIRIEGRLRLREEEDGTRLHWVEQGDFGWNPLLGYIAPRMEELQGAQLEASLTTLKRIVEEAREMMGGGR